MAIEAILATKSVSAEAELGRFIAANPDVGAVVSFCGIARGSDKAGDAVTSLHLDHYPGMTERSLEEIAGEGARRFDVSSVRVVHRCGTINPGEVIVFVAAASAHRRAAFLAADYLMDRLKSDAVFWKREEGVDGARWIEPTDADRADLARWNDTCPASTKA
jgi:molybdopterin synthase catalytic subunit